MGASAGLGNAPARLEAFVISTGTYAYGGYPDIDDLFRQQAQERDRKKREAMLHQIQRLMHERVMHAPDLRARHPARGRAASRGAGGRPEPAALLRRAVRGHAPQEAVSAIVAAQDTAAVTAYPFPWPRGTMSASTTAQPRSLTMIGFTSISARWWRSAHAKSPSAVRQRARAARSPGGRPR